MHYRKSSLGTAAVATPQTSTISTVDWRPYSARSTPFLNILKENGTLPHRSCPGTSQQNGRITLLLLYVDDTIITGDDTDSIQDLKVFLHRQSKMEDLGPLSYFLGLEVSIGSNDYDLSRSKYASEIPSRAGLTDSKIEFSPLEANVKFHSSDGEPLHNATLYRQLVGRLVYLTVT
ncbi:hypothetical protein RJ639_037764 [Escallonia herrerae]|uniref:Reverse transcriptase Ty1/copia-type domain-containing protein n=1 Tax=Escallonia herrerae TaxID=1293975 RepID=A0AA89BDW3_9ASTE|nr:hypothetical protein RJ639_037764 [Escallonia herrerae]